VESWCRVSSLSLTGSLLSLSPAPLRPLRWLLGGTNGMLVDRFVSHWADGGDGRIEVVKGAFF
jgi:hypothetical protein